MIRVELVRTKDGMLVGKTCSDWWNLLAAGIGAIRWDRNQAGVKAVRRRLVALGLTLSVIRNAVVQMHPTDSEADALGVVNVRRLGRVAA